MDQQEIKYASFHQLRGWHGVTVAGLEQEDEGVLSLAMVPGPPDRKAITIPSHSELDPSGLAVGACNDLVLSDTANHQVVWHDGVCPNDRILQLGNGAGSAPSQFDKPCGLLIHSDSLYVADSANSRVQIFRFPTLELRAIWSGMFTQPTGLAVDTKGNIYVLDRGLERVFRFTATGLIDTTYNPSNLKKPVFLAIDGEDRLYVSDADRHANQVFGFKLDGTPLAPLPLASASMLPRALAARGDRIYVADADSGDIWAFDSVSSASLGAISGYRGPVSAMAIGPDDSLWVKPGLDQVYYRLEPRKVFVSEGLLTTSEALDAGEDSDWARVHVDAEVSPGSSVQLKLIAAATETSPPSEFEWKDTLTLPLDALVPPFPGSKDANAGEKRFLWIRVIVTTENRSVSPRIFQIEAETASPSYLDHLPEVYRRKDVPTRFLERWLKLVQGEIDDWESALEQTPRRFDPLMAPEDQLSWLGKWLAFPLPSGDTDALRSIFAKVPELYTRRGTPNGIRDLAKLYTGELPHLFEAFHTRRVWQLGETSALGVETTLLPALPDGMLVPGWSMADPGLMGLRGDYYEGVNFERLRATRDDAQVDFNLVTAPAPLGASVRWTGQLQPRSTDLYTISTESSGGIRLWVDGRLIINNWNQPRQQDSGRIALTEGRWYPIVLEYFSETGGSAHLSWSSRNQPKEIIPQERLYRVRDEFASLEGPAAVGDSCPVLVGQTVVGESEPLSTAEYGAPLYNESAHLFTVSIPGAKLSTPAQREMLRDVIEREKPAHTDYHLCFVEAKMRVGFQSRIGIDSIVAGPPEPLSLEGTILGIESYLGDDETQGRIGRVGAHGHIGYDTVLG